jgi:hypothetical protein
MDKLKGICKFCGFFMGENAYRCPMCGQKVIEEIKWNDATFTAKHAIIYTPKKRWWRKLLLRLFPFLQDRFEDWACEGRLIAIVDFDADGTMTTSWMEDGVSVKQEDKETLTFTFKRKDKK